MAGGSTNPLRQQMINMMYLVLTALLALNVSADILKAFALVNKGLGKTNVSYMQKNELTMAQFAKLYDQDKEKAQVFWDNANKAKNISDQMYTYLDNIKELLAAKAGGWAENSNKATVEDDKNLEIATHYFVVDKAHHGEKLRDSLNWYVTEMKKLLGPGHENDVNFKIDTDNPPVAKDGTKKNWVEYYFEGVPVVAAITEITKFQNDVRNAQNEVTNFNFKQVGATDYKVSDLVPVVSTTTPSVYLGGKYKADIFLSAQINTAQPKIYVNGAEQQVEGGKSHIELSATAPGQKDLNVKIVTIDPATGKPKEYTTTSNYQVFSGQATISAVKMNMLYIGIDNPISVSVPGFRPDQVIASGTAGLGFHSAGKPGEYIAKPDGSTREGSISAVVKLPDGGTKSMGNQPYRIRRVPNPEVLFGTKVGGPISRGELNTVQFINAGLGEGFAYEGLKYTVNGYTFALAPRNGGNAYFEVVSGNRITSTVKNKLAQARPGDMIVIAEVKCTGPVGQKVLNGPTLTVR